MYLINFFIAAILLATSYGSVALESDSDQPVHIDSNTASYNDKTGTSVYTGDVKTVQGSLHIQSDKLVVYVSNGQIDKMVFTGKPAKFRQLPGKGKEEIRGQGMTGEYYPSKNKLVLIENAIVFQGSSRSESRLIVYDSKRAIIRAGEKSSGSKRVHSVFKGKPKNKEAE